MTLTSTLLFLADIDGGDAINGGVGAIILGVLGWLTKQMNGLKAEMKGEVKTEIAAEAGGVKTHIANQPLLIEAKREYASSDAFGRHVAEDRRLHEKQADEQRALERMLLQKLDGVKTEILQAGEARIVAVHDRINELTEAVGKLKGIVEVAVKRGGRS